MSKRKVPETVDEVADIVIVSLRETGVTIEDESRVRKAVTSFLMSMVEASETMQPTEREEAEATIQSLSDYVLSIIEDMGDLAEGQVELTQKYKMLSQEVVPGIAKLLERLDSIEQQIQGLARQLAVQQPLDPPPD